MTTYTQLRADIANWANNESTELTAALDTIIGLAELRLYRELDLRIYRESRTSATEPGNTYLALPIDCLVVRLLRLTSGAHLQNRDESFIREFWPDPTATGRPRYYALWDEETVLLAPTPDQGYPLTIVYTRQPAGLSATNTTTWLSTFAYDLLLQACLLEAAGYLEGVTKERMDMYQQRYGDAAQRVQAQDARNRGDDFLTRSMT
jgi:hypothetical protein